VNSSSLIENRSSLIENRSSLIVNCRLVGLAETRKLRVCTIQELVDCYLQRNSRKNLKSFRQVKSCLYLIVENDFETRITATLHHSIIPQLHLYLLKI